MKRRVHKVDQLSRNPYLNLYHLDMVNVQGGHSDYYMASRSKDIANLKLTTCQNKADGVVVFSVYGEKKDQVVLIRQYRCPLDDYIYEFPAGLVDAGETFKEAGIRELKEETGLDFSPVMADDMYCKPYYMTIGMTDESCGTVYGYAKGTPSTAGQEDTEEIEVIIADKTEVRRILREENVAIVCAYMLMHFLESEDGNPFGFLKL